MKLLLPEGLEERIAQEARAAFPRECCGLIEGVAERDLLSATQIHPARNLSSAPDAFEIDPLDHLAAAKRARARGRAIIGCYHSHPNGETAPSARDAKGGGEENFLWLIAATDGRACRLAAYLYSVETFAPIGLVIGADLVTSSSKTLSRTS